MGATQQQHRQVTESDHPGRWLGQLWSQLISLTFMKRLNYRYLRFLRIWKDLREWFLQMSAIAFVRQSSPKGCAGWNAHLSPHVCWENRGEREPHHEEVALGSQMPESHIWMEALRRPVSCWCGSWMHSLTLHDLSSSHMRTWEAWSCPRKPMPSSVPRGHPLPQSPGIWHRLFSWETRFSVEEDIGVCDSVGQRSLCH